MAVEEKGSKKEAGGWESAIRRQKRRILGCGPVITRRGAGLSNAMRLERGRTDLSFDRESIEYGRLHNPRMKMVSINPTPEGTESYRREIVQQAMALGLNREHAEAFAAAHVQDTTTSWKALPAEIEPLFQGGLCNTRADGVPGRTSNHLGRSAPRADTLIRESL